MPLGLLILGIAVAVGAVAAYAALRKARNAADKNFSDKPVDASTQTCVKCQAKTPVTTGLGKAVDDQINKSPKFTQKIKSIQAKGYVFEYGEAGKGSYYDKQKKRIVIDSNDKGNTKSILTTVAHEAGHADYETDPYVKPDGLTKDQYVKANTKRHLKDEGEATLTNVELAEDLKKNGGEEIDVGGSQSDKYKEIARKYPDPKDRDKARTEIGDLFADGEHPSTDPSKTYRDYYGKAYEDYYDKWSQGKK